MGRLRGCMWLTAGLVVALLAGIVGFITLQKATEARADTEGLASGPQVDVVVSASTIEVRSLLTAEYLELKQMPVEAVPEGAVRTQGEAEGKITLVDLYPGEVILAQRLLDPNVVSGDGRKAVVLAEDAVLMAFPAQDLMSRLGILKPGDHVDILVSLDFPANRGTSLLVADEKKAGSGGGAEGNDEEQVTFNLLQNITIAAVVAGVKTSGGDNGVPAALLVTINPQDALLLKYAKDADGKFDIVLRAPGIEVPFEVEPVDVDYMIHRYEIPTEVGR